MAPALNECGLQGALSSLIEATLPSLMSSSAAETLFVSENTQTSGGGQRSLRLSRTFAAALF